MFNFLKKNKDTNNEDMNTEFKSFLWNLANQTEKVESYLSVVLPKLFSDKTDEEIFKIKESILKNINKQ